MPSAFCQFDVRIVRGAVPSHSIEPFPAEAGAECVFVGRTRHEVHPEYGALARLEYDAHEQVAVTILRDLAAQAAEAHDCQFVRVLHAIGPVDVGEASVLVQVAAGHRHQAFAASRFLIDVLKQQAPIWKQEVWESGATWSEGTVVDRPRQSTTKSESGST